ncbi:MAG: DNA repair protein RecO [Alphaproteobacteria bacterium]|nr:DNA repair protein RecO [Alphaproteobacteria bacterium]
MLEWQDNGIILSVRGHGETGGIASILTCNHGRAMGYVYGATSTKKRGVLEPGNLVSVHWKAKSHDQLGTFTLELEKSLAAEVMENPIKLTAMQSACALADKTLPEREKHTSVYEGTKALMASFGTDIWTPTYIYWELGLLREIGFALNLSKCVVTSTTENLIYVSPKSGCAVSGEAGEIYKEKLLSLPPFLRGEEGFEDGDILDGLKLTGHFLLHRVFSQSNSNLPEPRLRLEEKIKDAVFSG